MSTYGYLAHHGIKGQKWGIRRYENEDGTLTALGKMRYKTSYLEKNPKRYKTGNGQAAMANMYYDIKKAISKENKGKSKEEIESLIKKEYKKRYKKDSDIYYNIGKNAWATTRQNTAPATLFGAIGSSANMISQMKNPDSPYNKWGMYSDQLIKKKMNDGLSMRNTDKYKKAKSHLESDYNNMIPYMMQSGYSKKQAVNETYSALKDHYKLTDEEIKELKKDFKEKN